jgi:hypothetical protein
LEVFGVSVAHLDDQFRIKSTEIYFDPLDLFQQMVPKETAAMNRVSGSSSPMI